jgi:hypothetical protein
MVAQFHYNLRVAHRNACGFVFAFILATPWLRAEGSPPAEELLKLDGKELVDAADDASLTFYRDECPYTADELITVAEKLLGVAKSVGFARKKGERMNPVDAYFEQACSKANEQQVDKLAEMYARFDPRSYEKSLVLPALASRLILREIASIRAEKRKANLVKSVPELAPELKAAPPELQEAWRVYQRATASFENGFPKVDVQIDVSANEKSFYKLIDAALAGSTGLEDEIRQFAYTGANCLNITTEEDAKDIAMLLMLLRERRLDEAIGAALRVAGAEGSTSSPEKIAGSIVELIEACGLDWEMIFAGGQAAKEVKGRWSGSSNPFLSALAKFGSERAGLLVNQLAHLSNRDARAAYIGAFATWIETTPKRQKCNGKDVGVGRSDDQIRAGKTMPQAVQVASLHATEEFSTVDCSEELALYALNIFGRTQAYSSIPALQALTRHVSSDVARDAATVLCAMGFITARQSGSAPVRFRILLNGKPISSGQRVAWTISSTVDTVSDRTEANADGVVELPRHHFLDTSRPAKDVEFNAWGHQANEPTFSATAPAPGSLDATTDVPVRLSPLEITLMNQDRLNAPAPQKAFLYFLPHREKSHTSDGLPDAIDGTYEVWMGTVGVNVYRDGYEVSAQPSISLPAVQDGIYDVLVGVAGAEVWRGIAKVGPGAPKIDAALKAGSDVRFEVVPPDGSPGFSTEIFKDGRKFEAESNYPYGYRALPCGKYEICIRGSEWFDEYRQIMKLKSGPDEVSYAGRQIFFAITEGSPAIIDFGKIHLEAIGQGP